MGWRKQDPRMTAQDSPRSRLCARLQYQTGTEEWGSWKTSPVGRSGSDGGGGLQHRADGLFGAVFEHLARLLVGICQMC